MCFSATASFAGGVIISSIGVVAIRKNREPSQRLFAAIPMVFGIQQISEGFVWFALQSPGHDIVLKVSAYFFLTLALVFWPTMLPLSVLLMENSEKRRRALHVFLAAGILVSLCYGMAMLIFKVTAQISSHHILYAIAFPQQLAAAASFSYLIVTLPPLFVSSIRRMYLLGIVMVLSYSVTCIFFKEYLISVWCLFAALASVIILWVVLNRKTVANG
ncbi:MAG: DUF6629 family protein [Eubacteriales bacterium]|jgi:hypothetical protein